MQYAEGTLGRIFTLRLEDGDTMPECIETFAREHHIERAFCTMLGGIGKGELVVGPEDSETRQITPMKHPIRSPHEALAHGTISPDEEGTPTLHMHAALGRNNQTQTGCIRPGVDVWLVGEVIIMEICGSNMLRKYDEASGFKLLSSK